MLVGALLLGVALVLAVVPISHDCGSLLFHPPNTFVDRTYGEVPNLGCEIARNGQRLLPVAMSTTLGLILFTAGLITRRAVPI